MIDFILAINPIAIWKQLSSKRCRLKNHLWPSKISLFDDDIPLVWWFERRSVSSEEPISKVAKLEKSITNTSHYKICWSKRVYGDFIFLLFALCLMCFHVFFPFTSALLCPLRRWRALQRIDDVLEPFQAWCLRFQAHDRECAILDFSFRYW